MAEESRGDFPKVGVTGSVTEERQIDLESSSASAEVTRSPAKAGELAGERTFTVKSVRPEDLALAREDMRGRIAASLVAILAFVVIAAFATVWTNGGLTAAMKDLLTIILGPVVTLVGSATGFYFGGGREGRVEPKADG